MEILILVLKILGIFLALLLLAIVALIAVPFHYCIGVKVQDETEGKIVFYWLCHLVDLRIWYEKKEVSYKLRILGIAISLNKEKKGKNISLEASDNNYLATSKGEEESAENSQSKEKDNKAKENLQDVKKKEENRKEDSQNRQEDENTEQSSWGKIKKKFSRKRAKKHPKIYKQKKDKTTALKEKIRNIKELVLEETNQNALFHVLQEFRYLLRHYSPRKAFGNIIFSMGNPAKTGEVLGAISIFPFWSRYKIIIIPDFETESFYLKGEFQVKGKIRSWHVLYAGIRLIKDKNIRKFLTSIR